MEPTPGEALEEERAQPVSLLGLGREKVEAQSETFSGSGWAAGGEGGRDLEPPLQGTLKFDR